MKKAKEPKNTKVTEESEEKMKKAKEPKKRKLTEEEKEKLYRTFDRIDPKILGMFLSDASVKTEENKRQIDLVLQIYKLLKNGAVKKEASDVIFSLMKELVEKKKKT